MKQWLSGISWKRLSDNTGKTEQEMIDLDEPHQHKKFDGRGLSDYGKLNLLKERIGYIQSQIESCSKLI